MAANILAVDQGTTGTTALILRTDGVTLARHNVEFPQHFPHPGWVSHNLREIWDSVREAVVGALKAASLKGSDIAAIGLTNQRETACLWDRVTGEPSAPAIVWQCRRTAEQCDAMKKDVELVQRIRGKTGLVLDAYFSATKFAWLLDEEPARRSDAESGKLCLGTIDSFLVHRLTGGVAHVTDVSNASRTLLLDLRSLGWDPELCRHFRVPERALAALSGNAERMGVTRGLDFLPDGIPITGSAGDQQAALFGQTCFNEGDAKCTYGTGAFVLMNIGRHPIASASGLVTTVAWNLKGVTTYALEGSSFVAGAAVQWLRDGLGLIAKSSDVEALAASVPSSEGVTFVPALTGLGAPHWDPHARGTIVGLTRKATKAHLARATLEGIALSVVDLLSAMQRDAKQPLLRLRVDGGASQNDLLMQMQADFGGVPIQRPKDIESTARGAAFLATLGAGLLADTDELSGLCPIAARFSPTMSVAERERVHRTWEKALSASRLGA